MIVFVHFWLLFVGLVALIVAAAVDVKLRLIPNPVVFTIAASGLGLRLLSGTGEALESFALAVAIFLPLGLLAGRRLMGGGDAKMIAAATLLVQPRLIPHLILAIALTGGGLAIVYVARRFRTWPVGRVSWFANGEPASRLVDGTIPSKPDRVSLPYGVAIAIGGGLLVLQGGFGCSSGTFC